MNVCINGKNINMSSPPYIIAEISGNHNGDINRAIKLIELANDCGADAVKIQTYTPDTMTINSNKTDFLINEGLWNGYSLYELYQQAHTPWEWHEKLFKKARDIGITIFSTPFDETSVDFLEQFNPPAYKIASFEIVDIPLIEKISKTGKPIIISTGMADINDINLAFDTLRNNGAKEIILLHCTSGYPTPISESNLITITDLHKKFDAVIGLSDHTLGLTAAITSIALGAKVIEKHFTLDRTEGGADAEFSIEPDELAALCQECSSSWLSIGKVKDELQPSELQNIKFRRSIYAIKDIRKGEKFTTENIRKIRPGFGLHPKYYFEILDKISTVDIEAGTPMMREFFNNK